MEDQFIEMAKIEKKRLIEEETKLRLQKEMDYRIKCDIYIQTVFIPGYENAMKDAIKNRKFSFEIDIDPHYNEEINRFVKSKGWIGSLRIVDKTGLFYVFKGDMPSKSIFGGNMLYLRDM